MVHRSALAALLVLLFSAAVGAQAPAQRQGRDAADTAAPVTLIENAQTRIVRVNIEPNSTRSMHSHDDMLWHVFVTMDAPIVLTIKGQEQRVELAPWQTHFFKGGTVHSITNPNGRYVQFLEFFAKR